MSDICRECGMPIEIDVEIDAYHPYAACLMFKSCHDSATVTANLDAVRANGAQWEFERHEADLATLRAQNAQLENDCNMLSLDRQALQERLAGYEDAPVVAWMDKSHDDRDIAVTVDELNRKDQYIQRLWKGATALIVKPAKEGTKT